MQQIIDETLPAVRKAQAAGKVRYVGISGYPQKIFHTILAQSDLDCVLSYNQYTLQNTRFADETIPLLKKRGVGIMNGGPFSARLLTNSQLPVWFRDPPEVQAAARRAAEHCQQRGIDIAQLALQFSLLNEDISTTVAGSANPQNIRKWATWAALPIDRTLLKEVQEIWPQCITSATWKVCPRTTSDVTSVSSGMLAESSPRPLLRDIMKAISLDAPEKFRQCQIDEPAAPGPDEALVRIHRIGICGTDYGGYLGKMPFFSYPRIPGHELGVEVLAVGSV